MSVHFIDVGQGDCELIISDGQTVLIDGGERDKGNVVVRYLKNCGIKKLDYVIATHPHTDHVGGLIKVFDNFPVGKLIMPRVPKEVIPTNATYKQFLKSINKNKLKVVNGKKGDHLTLGKGNLDLIAPLKDYYKKINNFSIAFLFKYGGTSFLLAGDMEKDSEKDVLQTKQNIKADVFKLSHHGSATSNTKRFLEAINPRYCVIEVGENNSYQLPSRKGLNYLFNRHKNTYSYYYNRQ